MSISIILGAVCLIALILWFSRRNTPAYPPLNVEADHPLMLKAIEKAKATTDKFLSLYSEGVHDCQVKIPFETNSGEIEHLWAAVQQIENDSLSLLYLTPPVSHSGKLDREHTHLLSEIEDWAVFTDEDKIYGGYTQRVMFDLAREQWGELPPELAEQESNYVT